MVLHNKVLKTLSNNFGGKIKIFFQDPKRMKKTYWHLESSSDNPAQQFLPETCKFLPQVPKTMKRIFW